MQRYQPDQDDRGRTAPMNEDKEGDYVLYADAIDPAKVAEELHKQGIIVVILHQPLRKT